MLGRRYLLLLPTIYVKCLDHASEHTRFAGVQNCSDRLLGEEFALHSSGVIAVAMVYLKIFC